MHLTEEQIRAVADRPAGPVRLTDPVSNREYVLVPADVYDKLNALYDDSPWTDDERDAMRAEAVDALGWEGMDAYQDSGS